MLNPVRRGIIKSSESAVSANITGKIPEWVNGTLYRNGPGRYEFGDKKYQHIFDGQACIQRFRIANGQVRYSNKILETKSYQKSLNEKQLFPIYGPPDHNRSFLTRVKAFLSPVTDNPIVNVAPFSNNQLYAMSEFHSMSQINPKDLSVVKSFNVKDHFDGIITSSAHPHVEPDGSWVQIATNLKKLHYDFEKYDGSYQPNELDNLYERGKVIASIPSSHKFGVSYFHSFGLTQNYIVFFEQSWQVNYLQMVKNLFKNKPFSEAMIKMPDWNARIRVVHKETGKEVNQKFFTDPLILFHHINAYERVDPKNKDKVELVVDFCGYDPKSFIIKEVAKKDPIVKESFDYVKLDAFAQRITVPLELNSKKNSETYCPLWCLNSDYKIDFPYINYERFNAKPYKYFYTTGQQNGSYYILKMNYDNKTDLLAKEYFEEGMYLLPIEPIFVEKPNPESEDDGIVLVIVLSKKNGYLSVLDAKDLKEIARAELPEDTKAVMTFHGFFADQRRYPGLNFNI